MSGVNTLSTGDGGTSGYHLDNFQVEQVDTLAVDSKGSNPGTYVSGPTLAVAGAITGDSNTAVQFDGVSDYGSVARQISDDFSIEFWFKSTQGIGTGITWWQGAGLVDADGRTSNDYGVSLRSDGRVVTGVGNPDTSIVSSSGGYSNGAWHQVVFTRTKSTGALQLYIDDASAGSATATNTSSLTSPANISFGRIQTGTNYFTGYLDEVAVYNTVLSAETVTSHDSANQ